MPKNLAATWIWLAYQSIQTGTKHTVHTAKYPERDIDMLHLLFFGGARALRANDEIVCYLHRPPLVRRWETSGYCKAVRVAAAFPRRKPQINK